MTFQKKGELTSEQIVTIVILIVSFSVILLFFLVFGFKSEITKETCRNSVVLRGSTPLGKETVRLQCKTQEVCITMGKNCGVERADVEVLKVKNKDDLLNHLADLMYDCWWQMGGGKINYAPSGWRGQYCVMCDVITFDDSIKNNPSLNKITLKELFVKLQEKKVPNGDANYLYYLYGFNSIGAALEAYGEKNEQFSGEILNSVLDFSQNSKYALVTAVESGASLPWTGSIAGAGALATAIVGAKTGAAVCTVVSPVVGTVICGVGGGVIAGTAAFLISSSTNEAVFLSPMYLPFDQDNIKKLECKSFSSLAS